MLKVPQNKVWMKQSMPELESNIRNIRTILSHVAETDLLLSASSLSLDRSDSDDSTLAGLQTDQDNALKEVNFLQKATAESLEAVISWLFGTVGQLEAQRREGFLGLLRDPVSSQTRSDLSKVPMSSSSLFSSTESSRVLSDAKMPFS